jgi:hypothetical protein
MPGPTHELTIFSRSWMARTTASGSRPRTVRESARASSRIAPSFERLRRDTIRSGLRYFGRRGMAAFKYTADAPGGEGRAPPCAPPRASRPARLLKLCGNVL